MGVDVGVSEVEVLKKTEVTDRVTIGIEGVSTGDEGMSTELGGVMTGVVDGGVRVASLGKGAGVTRTEDKLAASEVFSDKVRVVKSVVLSQGNRTVDWLKRISIGFLKRGMIFVYLLLSPGMSPSKGQ